MIPPVLLTPVAKIAAAGVLIASLWGWGYLTGRAHVQQAWDASLAQQAMQSMKEVAKASAMTSSVLKNSSEGDRAITENIERVEKEVIHHAKRNPQTLSPAVVSLYDRLISVPNEAGRRVPAPDAGPGASEVSRGGVATETTARVSLGDDEEPVELTTEELAQAAVDFADKYARMKNAYKGLSDWNDGREKIELERTTND